MEESNGRSAVLAGEHPLWLEAVERILRETGVEVVARAEGSASVVPLVEEHRPGVLVLDLPAGVDAAAVELLEAVRSRAAEVRVVVLGSADAHADIAAAFAAGASSYVVKRATASDLAAAFRQVFEQSIFLAQVPVPAPLEGTRDRAGDTLTRREREILAHAAEGASNGQIARELWVTEQTVKFHLANVYKKLGVANRTEASRWAQRHGLLDERPQRTPVLASS